MGRMCGRMTVSKSELTCRNYFISRTNGHYFIVDYSLEDLADSGRKADGPITGGIPWVFPFLSMGKTFVVFQTVGK